MHEPEIEYLIRSLGIGATYRGYEYLIYCIRLCLSDENYLLFVSKYLYPDIARHYNLSSSFLVKIFSNSFMFLTYFRHIFCLYYISDS